MKKNSLIILLLSFIAICGLTLVCAGIFGGITLLGNRISSTFEEINSSTRADPTYTPLVIRPIPDIHVEADEISETSEPNSTESEKPSSSLKVPGPQVSGDTETLETLRDTSVPMSDPIELAHRLAGKTNLSATVDPPSVPYYIGSQDTFWVINTGNNQSFTVGATLRYITEHSYFWIEDGLAYDQEDLQALAETFESQIYPTNRAFFGSEWSPGVDGDPHIYILYVSGLGAGVAGLFSPGDEYPPDVIEHSNAHEMFLLNADTVGLDESFTYGVLAHEYQHMIHWYHDRNEDGWLTEGFSELAMLLNGHSTGGVDLIYSVNPDIQLNHWPAQDQDTLPHYGASFLFIKYFFDRFGEQVTQTLVAEMANGLKGIDIVLDNLGITDPLNGKPVNVDDVFADWIVASYLQDEDVGDGRYTYLNYSGAPQPSATEFISSCPTDTLTRDVHQYGVDYISIKCRGEYILNFEGSVQVPVLPADPHSGSYAFWSNTGDESNMTLTRYFDFGDHSGPLSLDYWTWYDIEQDYDYLYLLASRDGELWQFLGTPSGTADDPTGNSYGWAYNGKSIPHDAIGTTAGWIQENLDISQFAGDQVYLRFEYITDAAVNGEGFLLDDVSIPEIGYHTGFEKDNSGWDANGFVRIQNILPQTFRISLIRLGDTTTVEHLTLPDDNSLNIPISFDSGTDELILVVSGTSRFTRQKAAYRLSIDP